MTLTPPPASSRLRVLRVFHAGRNPAHRARDRALTAAGADVVYVVPRHWPEPGAEETLSPEPFPIIEVDVSRPGDVNRHGYVDADRIAALATEHHVDLVDLFEEPFSRAAGALLPLLDPGVPVVMYSAQNLDKRWPPPFAAYERRSMGRVAAFYPCSRQAASVLRGKGYAGLIDPIPLGYDDAVFGPGAQSPDRTPLQLALVGRMVPEKGVQDAVEVLAALRHNHRLDASLVLAGSGPALPAAVGRAGQLGVADHVTAPPWLDAAGLAEVLRATHVVLAPSRSTATWVEQFGRMVVEGQASGCVVVGYDSGSLAEVGGEAAVLVGEGDVAALTAATARVLTDGEEYGRRREAGLQQAATMTWSRVAARQMALYRAAMEARPGPRLVGTPSEWRRSAVAEFGEPARALGQSRLFALPGLRRPNPVTRAVGRAFDAAGDARARLTSPRS